MTVGSDPGAAATRVEKGFSTEGFPSVTSYPPEPPTGPALPICCEFPPTGPPKDGAPLPVVEAPPQASRRDDRTKNKEKLNNFNIFIGAHLIVVKRVPKICKFDIGSIHSEVVGSRSEFKIP